MLDPREMSISMARHLLRVVDDRLVDCAISGVAWRT